MGLYKLASAKGAVALKNLAKGVSAAGLLGLAGGGINSFYQGVKKKKDDNELKKAVLTPTLGGAMMGLGAGVLGHLDNGPKLGAVTAGLATLGALSGLANYGFGRAVRSAMGGKEEPHHLKKTAKEQNDNSGLINAGLDATTLGGLGTGAYYAAKQKKHLSLLDKAKAKHDVLVGKVNEITGESKFLNKLKSDRQKEADKYKTKVVDRIENKVNRLGRNAKFGLAAAGLGAAGLAYDHFKNN
jgi:hypothetical protein